MGKPAVVLITCDELRRDALGCYGGQAVATPHIDALAEGGAALDSFYTVSPWCLPARCALLTGQYPHQTGAYSNFRKCELAGSIPNLFTQMRQGGYQTALVGKCHFAPVPYDEARADKTLPYEEMRSYYASLGIDHLVLQDDKQVSIWFYDDYSKELDAAGYLQAYRDANWSGENQLVYPFPAPAQWHPDAWVGRKAVEYLRQSGSDAPQFTWVSFSGPHYPYDAPEEYLARVNAAKLPPRSMKQGELDSESRIQHKSYHGGGNIDGSHRAPDKGCKNYSEEYWQRLRVSYHANVALIDDMVGEIVKAAREKYGEDCLVLFTADHGEMLGNHGVWGKHNCGYDDVWKIPMVMQGPGVPAGQRSEAMANLNDILPTVLDAAGLPPLQTGVLPLGRRLRGEGLEYTFAEGEGYAAVTDGRYKYIHIEKPGEHYRELLDTKIDPGEFENKIDDPACAGALARLREKLVEHFMATVLP